MNRDRNPKPRTAAKIGNGPVYAEGDPQPDTQNPPPKPVGSFGKEVAPARRKRNPRPRA